MSLLECNATNLMKSHIQVAKLAYAAGEYTGALKNLNTAQLEIENHNLLIDDQTSFDLKKFFGKVRTTLQLLGQAESDFQAAVELANSSSEISKIDYLSAQRHLADCIRLRGRFDQSQQIYEEVISSIDAKNPTTESQLAKGNMGLAQVLIDSGRPEEAKEFIDRAIHQIEDKKGSKCFWYGRALLIKARLLCMEDKNLEALELYQQAVSIITPLIGPEHPLSHLLEQRRKEPMNTVLAELKSIEKHLHDHDLTG